MLRRIKDWMFKENGYKIERREVKTVLIGVVLGIGTWLLALPIQKQLVGTTWGSVVAGATIITVILLITRH